MEIRLSCSLCYSSCNNYKFMQNEKGESTEVYDVAVKYFDPMILTEDLEGTADTSLTRVLCIGCWSHIHDFHEFQQIVLKSRTLLRETNSQKTYLHPKRENTLVLEENKDLMSDDMPDKEYEGYNSDADNDLLKPKMFRVAKRKSKNRIKKLSKLKTNRVVLKNGTNELKGSVTPHNYVQCEEPTRVACLAKPFNDRGEDQISDVLNVAHANGIDIEQYSSARKIRRAIDVSESSEDETHHENTNERREANKPKNSLKEERSALNPSSGHITKFEAVKQNKGNPLSKSSLKAKCIESNLFLSKWKPNLDCDLCTVTVANFDEMRDHFRKAHHTRSYIKCCERRFYRRSVLIDHIRLHVNPETYKCDICGKPSTTRYNLKKHKQIMHSDTKQFECDTCHKEFNQKTNLDRHLLTHVEGDKKFFCKECGRGYVLEVQLNNHIKSVHEDDSVCDQCGKTIHGAGAIKKHLMEHAGTKRKFPCDVCGVEIVSKIGLKRHKAAYHHDGSTAYVCGICGKVASSENALRSHKNYVHENNRKYKCTYCDKAFIRPKGLREHIATHTGVDLYQCPHCPQTFKVSANMHHHRKRAHPIEWEEARRNRVKLPKVNIEQVKNQIVL